MSIVRNLAGIAKGMSITLRRDASSPPRWRTTPTAPAPCAARCFQQRFRGAHVLQRDENGLEKCVACFLCAAACPANCIYIEAADNTEEQRISSSERYAKVYNIDYNRCIFCGYCVEACPTDAITHGHGFELATLNATNLVMRKEDMLVPVAGAHRSEIGRRRTPFRFPKYLLDSRMPPSIAEECIRQQRYVAWRLRNAMTNTPANIRSAEDSRSSRIAIIDGAMGTTIRTYGMTETDMRGERFKDATEGPAQQRRPLLAHAADDDRRHSSPLSRGRRRHHRDQHLWRHHPLRRASSSSTTRASTAAAKIPTSTRRSSRIHSLTVLRGISTRRPRGSAASGPIASAMRLGVRALSPAPSVP